MKKFLPFLSFLLFFSFLNGQCDDLFISEYVEGYANNKALEFYNPTDQNINLSEYSIIRFRNGSTETPPERTQQLPDFELAPDDVFVVVIDLTDVSQFDSQFDKPAWNGYNLIDTIFDIVTGEPVLDSLGNIVFGPQFNENGSALFGFQYNAEFDLQCKADAFLNPEFEDNNSMYFNGNDAVGLIKGTELSVSGDNLVDVVGVIGEDPEETIMEPAWVNEEGRWMTRNSTIIRDPGVASGRNNLNDVIAQLGGTFDASEWIRHPNNSFQFLGTHKSDCNVTAKEDTHVCEQPTVSNDNINIVGFSMFPNPNNGDILNFISDEKIISINVFNFIGQKVKTQLNNNSKINISDLETGMYIVQLGFENNRISTQKLIIE